MTKVLELEGVILSLISLILTGVIMVRGEGPTGLTVVLSFAAGKQ